MTALVSNALPLSRGKLLREVLGTEVQDLHGGGTHHRKSRHSVCQATGLARSLRWSDPHDFRLCLTYHRVPRNKTDNSTEVLLDMCSRKSPNMVSRGLTCTTTTENQGLSIAQLPDLSWFPDPGPLYETEAINLGKVSH